MIYCKMPTISKSMRDFVELIVPHLLLTVNLVDRAYISKYPMGDSGKLAPDKLTSLMRLLIFIRVVSKYQFSNKQSYSVCKQGISE